MKKLEKKEWNFLIGDQWTEKDKELFFGPLAPDDVFIELPADITFPEILSMTNVFRSNTDARKNGWGKPQEATFKWFSRKRCAVVDQAGIMVPQGFTDFRAGKGKLTRITIFRC